MSFEFLTDTHTTRGQFIGMSEADILAGLSKLTPAERQEVRLQLAKLDAEEWLNVEDPLTDAEKALLNGRLATYEKDPDAGRSWEEVEIRIRARLKE